MLILDNFQLTEASDSTLFDQAMNHNQVISNYLLNVSGIFLYSIIKIIFLNSIQNSAQSFPASIRYLYKNYRGLFPSHQIMRPLIHADQKQKRVNFRTENLSDMERKMKKRLARNWKPELYPENENPKLDINPASTNGMTLENQIAVLQLLLRMKSQGVQIPEYRMNVVRVNYSNNHEIINHFTSHY